MYKTVRLVAVVVATGLLLLLSWKWWRRVNDDGEVARGFFSLMASLLMHLLRWSAYSLVLCGVVVSGVYGGIFRFQSHLWTHQIQKKDFLQQLNGTPFKNIEDEYSTYQQVHPLP